MKNIEIFLETLSEEEYFELEKIVLRKKELRDMKGMKITDFLSKHVNEMSGRCITLLNRTIKDYVYIEELNRTKLYRYEYIGLKTLSELEYFLKSENIDITYYNTGRLNIS